MILEKDKLDILRESSSDERIGYELIQKYLFHNIQLDAMPRAGGNIFFRLALTPFFWKLKKWGYGQAKQINLLYKLFIKYEMPRPFTLNIFALRIIPNTQLAKDVEKRGFDIPSIDADYQIGYHRTMGNVLVFFLTVFKMPRWLYKYLRNKIYPVHTKQTLYPVLFTIVRTLYFAKRAFDHLRFMDFSILSGKSGYLLWKIGIIKFWKKFVLKQYRLPETKLR